MSGPRCKAFCQTLSNDVLSHPESLSIPRVTGAAGAPVTSIGDLDFSLECL